MEVPSEATIEAGPDASSNLAWTTHFLAIVFGLAVLAGSWVFRRCFPKPSSEASTESTRAPNNDPILSSKASETTTTTTVATPQPLAAATPAATTPPPPASRLLNLTLPPGGKVGIDIGLVDDDRREDNCVVLNTKANNRFQQGDVITLFNGRTLSHHYGHDNKISTNETLARWKELFAKRPPGTVVTVRRSVQPPPDAATVAGTAAPTTKPAASTVSSTPAESKEQPRQKPPPPPPAAVVPPATPVGAASPNKPRTRRSVAQTGGGLSPPLPTSSPASRFRRGAWTPDEKEQLYQAWAGGFGTTLTYRELGERFVTTRSAEQLRSYVNKHKREILRESRKYRNKQTGGTGGAGGGSSNEDHQDRVVKEDAPTTQPSTDPKSPPLPETPQQPPSKLKPKPVSETETAAPPSISQDDAGSATQVVARAKRPFPEAVAAPEASKKPKPSPQDPLPKANQDQAVHSPPNKAPPVAAAAATKAKKAPPNNNNNNTERPKPSPVASDPMIPPHNQGTSPKLLAARNNDDALAGTLSANNEPSSLPQPAARDDPQQQPLPTDSPKPNVEDAVADVAAIQQEVTPQQLSPSTKKGIVEIDAPAAAAAAAAVATTNVKQEDIPQPNPQLPLPIVSEPPEGVVEDVVVAVKKEAHPASSQADPEDPSDALIDAVEEPKARQAVTLATAAMESEAHPTKTLPSSPKVPESSGQTLPDEVVSEPIAPALEAVAVQEAPEDASATPSTIPAEATTDESLPTVSKSSAIPTKAEASERATRKESSGTSQPKPSIVASSDVVATDGGNNASDAVATDDDDASDAVATTTAADDNDASDAVGTADDDTSNAVATATATATATAADDNDASDAVATATAAAADDDDTSDAVATTTADDDASDAIATDDNDASNAVDTADDDASGTVHTDDDDASSVPETKEPVTYPVGTRVRKFFNTYRGYFPGEIRSYDAQSQLYSIEYEDGDQEELEHRQIDTTALPSYKYDIGFRFENRLVSEKTGRKTRWYVGTIQSKFYGMYNRRSSVRWHWRYIVLYENGNSEDVDEAYITQCLEDVKHKRGRPKILNTSAASETKHEANSPKRKKGRPKNTEVKQDVKDVVEPATKPSSDARKRKRGRPRKMAQTSEVIHTVEELVGNTLMARDWREDQKPPASRLRSSVPTTETLIELAKYRPPQYQVSAEASLASLGLVASAKASWRASKVPPRAPTPPVLAFPPMNDALQQKVSNIGLSLPLMKELVKAFAARYGGARATVFSVTLFWHAGIPTQFDEELNLVSSWIPLPRYSSRIHGNGKGNESTDRFDNMLCHCLLLERFLFALSTNYTSTWYRRFLSASTEAKSVLLQQWQAVAVQTCVSSSEDLRPLLMQLMRISR